MDELAKLLDGNKRFVEGRPMQKDLAGQRKDTLAGQHPFVTVVSCSDSRVVPEYLFDAGIGELFVVRLAGNVVDSCALGSIEYGVEHLHTPLLVVLGHEKCGAVTAACKMLCEHNHIDSIIEKIKPVVGKTGPDDVEKTIEQNVLWVRDCIVNSSKPVKEKVAEGKLTVVGLKYSLTTGKVEQVE